MSTKQQFSRDMSTSVDIRPIKAMSRKELAAFYGISVKTLTRYLDRHFEKKYKGVRIFLPKDVQLIFELL